MHSDSGHQEIWLFVLGHSLIRSLVRSHRSLVRSLANSFAPELVGQWSIFVQLSRCPKSLESWSDLITVRFISTTQEVDSFSCVHHRVLFWRWHSYGSCILSGPMPSRPLMSSWLSYLDSAKYPTLSSSCAGVINILEIHKKLYTWDPIRK